MIFRFVVPLAGTHDLMSRVLILRRNISSSRIRKHRVFVTVIRTPWQLPCGRKISLLVSVDGELNYLIVEPLTIVVIPKIGENSSRRPSIVPVIVTCSVYRVNRLSPEGRIAGWGVGVK